MKRILLMLLTLSVLTGCGSVSASDDKSSVSSSEEVDAEEVFVGDEVNNSNTVTHETMAFDTSDDIIEIEEKLFIAQSNDIYINTEDYLGKTIKYQGMFDAFYYEETGITYYYVYRYGPGCCGYDGIAGFEVVWDGEYPEVNDWVEVVGVLEEYEEDGYMYLQLRLSSLTVMDERGAEYVAT